MDALELVLRLIAFASLFVGGFFVGRRAGWEEAERAVHRRAFKALRERCAAPGDARSAAFHITRSVVRSPTS